MARRLEKWVLVNNFVENSIRSLENLWSVGVDIA